MSNRLDNTNCPELDPTTYVTPLQNLKEDLQDMGLTLDKDFVLFRDGEPVGSVFVEDGLAFELLNPVY